MKIRITDMYLITEGVYPGQESRRGDEKRAEGNDGREPTEEIKAEQPERGGDGDGTPLQCSCLENPWMAEPCRLLSMGSRRAGHD